MRVRYRTGNYTCVEGKLSPDIICRVVTFKTRALVSSPVTDFPRRVCTGINPK